MVSYRLPCSQVQQQPAVFAVSRLYRVVVFVVVVVAASRYLYILCVVVFGVCFYLRTMRNWKLDRGSVWWVPG